jgi:hypothetical protein
VAKDDRLYGKFTLDFADNPKILPLSAEAFRCLVEATLYSRRMLTDGFLASRLAVAKWGLEVLQELATNDSEKPSLIEVDGGWMIRDYADHQDTKAEVEQRRARNKVNGSLGGQARAKRVASKSLSEIQAETETETVTSKEVTARKRASRVPRDFAVTDEMRAWAAAETPLVDVDKKLGEWIDYWSGVPGEKGVKLDWLSTWRNGMRKQQEFAVKDGVKPAPKTRTSAEVAARRRERLESPSG